MGHTFTENNVMDTANRKAATGIGNYKNHCRKEFKVKRPKGSHKKVATKKWPQKSGHKK